MNFSHVRGNIIMNISQYEAFIKTVELNSLTKAAAALGYTQSGISHMLNALESDCGLKLLIRDRAGVRITSDGLQLIPYFQSICNCQHNLTTKINEIHRMESGLIRIGTFNSVSAQWLPGIISRFRSDFPKMQFELLHGTDVEIDNWLLNGRIDCSFVQIQENKEFDVIFLKRDPLYAILPENHELVNSPYFPMKALTEYPYIKLYEGDENEITDLFRSLKVVPNTQFIARDDYTVIAMVENGLGFSVLPELVLNGTSRKIVVKELEVPAYRDLGIAVKDKSLLSVSAQTFLTYVQSWISEEYAKNK